MNRGEKSRTEYINATLEGRWTSLKIIKLQMNAAERPIELQLPILL